MSYLITLTNGTVLGTIPNYQIDSTHTSIDLPGQGFPNFGQYLLNGIVNNLENFSDTTSPAYPLTGQLWFNSSTLALNIYNGAEWTTVGGNVSLPAYFTASDQPVFAGSENGTVNPNSIETFYGSDNQNYNGVIITGQNGLIIKNQSFSQSGAQSGPSYFTGAIPLFAVSSGNMTLSDNGPSVFTITPGTMSLSTGSGPNVLSVSTGSLTLLNGGDLVMLVSPGSFEISNNGPPIFQVNSGGATFSDSNGSPYCSLTTDGGANFQNSTGGGTFFSFNKSSLTSQIDSLNFEIEAFTISNNGDAGSVDASANAVAFVHQGSVLFANNGNMNFDNGGTFNINSGGGLQVSVPTIIDGALGINENPTAYPGIRLVVAGDIKLFGEFHLTGPVGFSSSNNISSIGTLPGTVMYVSDDGGGIAYVDNSGTSHQIQGASLWAPGAPTLADWTALSTTSTISTIQQNGTNTVAISVPNQVSTTTWGGWTTPVPTAPYKTVFGLGAVGDANGGLFGLGWTDGADNYFYAVFNVLNFSVMLCTATGSGSFQTSTVVANTITVANAQTLVFQPYVQLILEDDGTNVSITFTTDGVNGSKFYSGPNNSGPLSAYSNFFFGIGPVDAATVGATWINWFLYDINGLTRLPKAPSY